ncbi:MAG TPA: response regulator [Bryobacteraceae bacterium]|nr:response regulator [Bryobacteraceae bacterium]
MTAETILLVDDEASVRSYIRNILRREGFQVLEGVDGVDALQQVERHQSPVDLLVTDIRMPRMDGLALARSVNEKFPATPILYISGFPFDLEEERTLHPATVCAFLAKPFSRQTLVEAVRKCLSRARHTA